MISLLSSSCNTFPLLSFCILHFLLCYSNNTKQCSHKFLLFPILNHHPTPNFRDRDFLLLLPTKFADDFNRQSDGQTGFADPGDFPGVFVL